MSIPAPDGISFSAVCQYVCQLWSEVLRVDDVALDSHFLDLGGDSLSAMLCISRIRSAYGIELSFEDFLAPDTGTVRGIASEVTADSGKH
ncbi:acyl carrier protein [Granulicella aggregans]|uniref:Acyl carrier protein n=1 Tax=Granulicella aggregans TaxID=474949 RepID=A0A7W7ZFB8_9BACT|nr:acyl carrier protein [Granulicella aggregans]